MENNQFEERYQKGDLPWDHGQHDFNLENMIRTHPIQPCHALDLGCGTGTNTVWLAKQGFHAFGFDLSPTAIERARGKAATENVDCSFQVGDLLKTELKTTSFGFIFDRGCFHCMPEEADKVGYVSKVASLLDSDGIWLSLIGNADEPPREVGPPRMTAAEITRLVEPRFRVLSLTSGVFGDRQEDPPQAWICLMQRRLC